MFQKMETIPFWTHFDHSWAKENFPQNLSQNIPNHFFYFLVSLSQISQTNERTPSNAGFRRMGGSTNV